MIDTNFVTSDSKKFDKNNCSLKNETNVPSTILIVSNILIVLHKFMYNGISNKKQITSLHMMYKHKNE